MRIQKIDPSKLSQAYNILCQGVYPVEGATHFPFGTTYCEVEPLGFSLRHAHHDNETFLILAGTGVMEIAGEKAIVAPGSVILIPPHSSHRLDNTSDTDRLKFISIYWTAPLVEGLPQDLIVIPAPPTPNGPLHLGHLSGPYLAADVFTRYAAGRGSRAFHAMGTDDNQCYVLAKGRQLGLTGEEVAARFVPTIMGALKKFGCQVDAELHPLGVYPYTQFVQHTFSRLIDKGVLELRRVPTPFCEDTQQFLYGAQVSGGCPHCGVTTNGNGCEACGYYNDCSDLVAPKSNVGRGPVVLKEAEKYYFPLSRYGEALSEILSQVVMHPKLREFYLGYLEKGLPDVAVSQFGTWGVPCAERPGQVLYEWFEMAGSYLFLAQSVQKEHGTADFWRSNEAGVVEAFGIDNSFFYGLLMPALLREIDPMVKAPRAFLWNYFFQLEGKKFSTSRGHAIWADEILSAVPPDSLRFYLSLSRSEDRETNYDLSECEAFVRSELAGRWDGFLRDLDADLEKAGRAVPAYPGAIREDHERFLARLNAGLFEIHENYSLSHFSLNRVAAGITRLMNETIGLYHRERNGIVRVETLHVVVKALSGIAPLLTPVMPEFGPALVGALAEPSVPFGRSVRIAREGHSVARLPLGHFERALIALSEFKRKSRERV